MAESFLGEVRNGVIVPIGAIPPLPEGTRVRVESIDPSAPEFVRDDPLASTRSWLLSLAREAESDLEGRSLPSDLSERHDHYAHGKPLT